jgi:D-serine deaminase-like pyridoxal phosphate-dependent protein
MPDPTGQTLDVLDSPQLLIDLDRLDANLRFLRSACERQGVALRVHFKSLKCGSLARYLASSGVEAFLCAKLNEAEVLMDAGIRDILIANQIIGPIKLARLANLARRGRIRVCVDDPENVIEMGQAARAAGVTIEVLVEVDIGMSRCGVEPGPAAVALAQLIQAQSGLRFVGLQGYDGQLQLLPDAAERETRCHQGLAQLIDTRRLIEETGLPVEIVTGAGTGTWEFTAGYPGMTEIQPGSFLLMDSAYHPVRPEFGCSLSVLATVVSRRPGWYVLDAGSKAISRDYGTPVIKDHPDEKVNKLSEEHTRVDCGNPPQVGTRREVLPGHCCATMNLHRQCVAVRQGRVEGFWPIEASGRYD